MDVYQGDSVVCSTFCPVSSLHLYCVPSAAITMLAKSRKYGFFLQE